jgi:hypothetical protein
MSRFKQCNAYAFDNPYGPDTLRIKAYQSDSLLSLMSYWAIGFLNFNMNLSDLPLTSG